MIAAKLATMAELQTVYGLRDMYDLWEVVCVTRTNEALAMERED